MRHLFLSPEQLTSSPTRIEGAEAHHLLNVLRVRIGETLTLLDNQGHGYEAKITALEKKAVIAEWKGEAILAPEPLTVITVAQALGKGDKFEQVIQHATEIGASAFIPLLTERTVIKVDAKEAENKRERWQAIVKGAAEQAGRARIPVVKPVATLSALCRNLGLYDAVCLLHTAPAPTQAPAGAQKILLIVGPEGGFSDREVEQAEAAGAALLSLGPYVLRTETAALVAVSRLV